MIVLNEKDADRIASYLRKRFEEVERENSFSEQMRETYSKMLNSSGADSKGAEIWSTFNEMFQMRNNALKAEIAELIALLMTGSEE